MSIAHRNGNYPPPPHPMPDRLSGGEYACPIWLYHALFETERVDEAFIQDGYPGACVLYYQDGVYADYDIGLTIDRAEHYAAARMMGRQP